MEKLLTQYQIDTIAKWAAEWRADGTDREDAIARAASMVDETLENSVRAVFDWKWPV